MQVAKWGNSLAVRLPAGLVEALKLKPGDHIEIRIAGERQFEVEKTPDREELLARLRQLRGMIPADFKFDRSEVYERGQDIPRHKRSPLRNLGRSSQGRTR